MEDKIVGPLTLVQFLYLLGGGLIVYVLLQSVGSSSAIFLLLAIPISIFSLGMAFLKIQDQPLSHFIKAGIYYFSHPKTRYWKRVGITETMLINPPKKVINETIMAPKKVEKSDLEKLAHVLDTGPLDTKEKRNFGSITNNFEKMIQQGVNQQKTKTPNNIRGGQIGTMGQPQTTSK